MAQLPSPGPRRSATAQLLFIVGVIVSGSGLFIPDPTLRQAALWLGALIAGLGLLTQPTRSASETRLRILLGLAMLIIVARMLTGYRVFDLLLIAMAILIGAFAAYMRYGPRGRARSSRE